MAAAVREKTISATELLDLTFQRIDLHNPKLNAIVWECRDEARARAEEADRRLAKSDREIGALHGVPITIKEAFAYRGSPSTWGLPALKDALSPRTATAIARLEAAGAIVVGKTNVPVMLGDWQTYNPVYGVSNNPWDVSKTPGGSTGGGAAAVAVGMGALTMGSDLSGSIRIPAHFCGVYGHKPSLELVSMAGFQPGPWDGSPGPPMDISVVGPLARSARDLGLALGVLGGSDADEAVAWSWRPPTVRHTRLKDFRIGYVFDDRSAPIASDIAERYEAVLSALSRTGAKMERGWPAGTDTAAAARTFGFLLSALVTADLNVDDESEQARKRGDGSTAAPSDHARWLRETRRRLAYRAAWQKYFESYDVFLLPSSFSAAFPHDHSEPMNARTIATPEGKRPYIQNNPYWITVASLAGLPATVAPIGLTDSGLPVGVQIVAPMWEDATSIEFAALLSEAVGGFSAPPE